MTQLMPNRRLLRSAPLRSARASACLYPIIDRLRPRILTSANLLNAALHCLELALYAAMMCSNSLVAACVTVMARSGG